MGKDEQPFVSWESFVEDYLQEALSQDEVNEEEYALLLERLEQMHRERFNLNTAERDDLLELPFLSEEQVDSLLSRRARYRLFRSMAEVVAVRKIPIQERRYLSLFAYAGDTLRPRRKWRDVLRKGRHEVETTVGMPLYRRAGYTPPPQGEMDKAPANYFLGSPWSQTVRYRFSAGRMLRFGFTAQKDEGEPFGSRGNYPYDFLSFHFMFRPQGTAWTFAAGDYRVHFADGLIVGSNALITGGRQVVEQMPAVRSRLTAAMGANEANYLRGAAARYKRGRIEALAFAAINRVDARVEDGEIRSFQTDGLHRTQREWERRRAATRYAAGGRLGYRFGHTLQAGLQAVYLQYNMPVQPALREYNKYYLRGRSALGFSADYRYAFRHWSAQGEGAFDKNLHVATTHTLRYDDGKLLSLSAQVRAFSPRYVTPLGQTTAQGTRVQNEVGFLVGGVVTPSSLWRAMAYLDLYRFPRTSYRAWCGANGLEAFAQTAYTPNEHNTWDLQYRFRTRQQNLTGYKQVLQYVSSHRANLRYTYQAARVAHSATLAGTLSSSQFGATRLGYLGALRTTWQCTHHLKTALFASLFFTDDYASRLFVYEPQLPHSAAFPSFYYHGWRGVVQAQYVFARWWQLGVRCGCTHYFNRKEISSGPMLIASSTKTDLLVQLRYVLH